MGRRSSLPYCAIAMKGEGEFKAGDHCQFCKVKATCRKRAEFNLEMAKYDFEMPSTLEDHEVEAILMRVDQLVSWAEDVKEYALNQALQGKEYQNFKVVEGRSNRKYTDEEAVAYALYGIHPTYDIETMSPNWEIPNLYTALYFALFYTRPEYEVYRKCANPNCNRLFKVKTTNSRKQYHNTACQNAAAQMRHRKLGK